MKALYRLQSRLFFIIERTPTVPQRAGLQQNQAQDSGGSIVRSENWCHIHWLMWLTLTSARCFLSDCHHWLLKEFLQRRSWSPFPPVPQWTMWIKVKPVENYGLDRHHKFSAKYHIDERPGDDDVIFLYVCETETSWKQTAVSLDDTSSLCK